MSRFLVILFLRITFAVSVTPGCKQPQPKGGSSSFPSPKPEENVTRHKVVTSNLKASITGIWAAVGDDNNATMVMEKDSITYPDAFASYKYKTERDSIRIYYDDYVGTYHIKMRGNDTLILTGEEELYFYRFDKP